MGLTFTTASSQYAVVVNTLGIDGGAITLMCWIKITAEIGAGRYSLISQGNTTSKVSNVIFYDYNAGTRRLAFERVREGAGEDIASYTVTLGTSNWYHVAMTYDASNVNGYVNGALVAGPTASTGNGSSGGSNDFVVGISSGGANASSNIIHSVRVWNTALTAAQVADEARSFQPVHAFSNLKYWNEFENQVLPATYPDMSQTSGQALTPTSTPTVDQGAPY